MPTEIYLSRASSELGGLPQQDEEWKEGIMHVTSLPLSTGGTAKRTSPKPLTSFAFISGYLQIVISSARPKDLGFS